MIIIDGAKPMRLREVIIADIINLKTRDIIYVQGTEHIPQPYRVYRVADVPCIRYKGKVTTVWRFKFAQLFVKEV